MLILIEALLVAMGLVMLYFGAEWLIRGSVTIANKFRISQLVIGLTIVAFGTSTPELAVSMSSAVQGLSDVALGNVVGSNIANIGLILGISAIMAPIVVSKGIIRKEIPILIGVSVLLLLLSIDKVISILDGIILVIGLVGFTIFSYKTSKKEILVESDSEMVTIKKNVVPKAVILIGIGLGLLTIGSFVTVDNAIKIAQHLNISERVIGLTLVAVGTSLPELITSIVAAKKGHADLSIGNILGSNVFNILAIVGLTSTVSMITVNDMMWSDYYVMLGFAFILIPIMRSGFVVKRIEGFLLLVGYLAYTGILIILR